MLAKDLVLHFCFYINAAIAISFYWGFFTVLFRPFLSKKTKEKLCLLILLVCS